jgi:cytochrome bd-type quinol oxidase subunit 2
MLSRIKQSIIVLALLLVPAFTFALPATVHAAHIDGHTDIQGQLIQGSCLSTDPDACPVDASPDESINDLISDVINIFSLVVGVVAVIMIIIGGFRYITSGGDSNNVTAAKNTILYAIIGLVIVALAQFIVRFVLARVTG